MDLKLQFGRDKYIPFSEKNPATIIEEALSSIQPTFQKVDSSIRRQLSEGDQYIYFKHKMQNKHITHWSPEEQLHYNIFLLYKANQLLNSKNKQTGFYVSMSSFIPSRSKVQCRSHHQKMIARFKTDSNCSKTDLELMNLRSFYKDHLALRLLDSQHLLKEIDHHLKKKLDSGVINKEFYCQFRETAQKNIIDLNFDSQLIEIPKKLALVSEKTMPQYLTQEKTDTAPQDYEFNFLFDPIQEDEFLNIGNSHSERE